MMDTNISNPRDKVKQIHRLLLKTYGSPQRHALDPIAELVSTILSQSTNDTLRDRAFDNLRRRFSTWEHVRDAPVKQIIAAIKMAGLSQQKGPRIKAALQYITAECGELNLDFLAGMPVDEARAWLMAIDGVGPKTAAIVLLFSFGRPAFPVDTHIHRVSTRLGLIPPKTSPEKAHAILEALVPPAWYYPLHLTLIAHGRAVCAARNPKCEICPLRACCDYYQTVANE
jgi:endonuclease III